MKRFAFKSARKKLLASFLVVLIIPVVVGAGGYARLRQNMTAESQKAYVDKLGQAMSGVDGLYDELDHLAGALKTTQWVGKIAYMQGNGLDYSRSTVYDLSVYASELENYQSLNNYIDRIMIVFPQKNIVMSMNGISSIEDFFGSYYKADAMTANQWKALLGRYTDGTTLAPMNVSNYGKKARMLTYIRTINLPSSNTSYVENTPIATLMISLVISGTKADGTSKYELQNLLKGVSGADGASSYIVGPDGVVASLSAGGVDFSSVLPSLSASGKAVSSFRYEGRGYLGFIAQGSRNSWRYVAVIPQAVAMAPVNAPMVWLVLLFAVCTCASFALAYALFRSNYKPLKSLVDRMTGIVPNGQDGKAPVNEYNLIDQAFQHVVAEEYSLQNKLEFYYPMAVQSFFIRLLYDMAGKVDSDAAVKSLGISAGHGDWTVAVLYTENPEGLGPERTKAVKLISDDRPVYVVEIDANRYAAVINATDCAQVNDAVAAVEEACLGGREDRVIVGVGNPICALEQISRSYREALSAVNCAFNEAPGQDGIVFYGSIEPDRSFGYHIRQETEDDLQKLLRSGDTAQLREYLEPYMDRHIKKAGTSDVAIQIFFYNLLSIALKAATSGELPVTMLIDEQRLMTMNTTKSMKEYIGNVYIMVCESLRSERRGHAQKVRSDILKFIDDNCLDDKLTLQSLSDIFGVTVPYLSKFIKDQTGNNFLDYVARKRIQIAKEMLKTGEYSIQQVGERVGYMNALTFRRVFKKIEGVNPGDYRARSGSAG